MLPSATFLILAAAWSFTRRKLMVFVLPVGLMIALYAFVYGTAHHQGTLFLAAITGIWIAWPATREQRAMQGRELRMYQGMVALVLCLCAVNIYDAGVVICREYLYPYSGAEDAAQYLKAVGADRGPIFGYGFGISAVQANFDHNILANIPTSYTHNGLPGWHNTMNVEEEERINPQYVVAFPLIPTQC
jgi:hypothetical protein